MNRLNKFLAVVAVSGLSISFTTHANTGIDNLHKQVEQQMAAQIAQTQKQLTADLHKHIQLATTKVVVEQNPTVLVAGKAEAAKKAKTKK